MGHNKWACMALRELIKNGHDIVGVITEKDEFDKNNTEHYASFAKFGAYEFFKDVAVGLNLPVYQPDDVNSPEWIQKIDSMRPDLIVVVSYHSILKGKLLQKYNGRIINAHAAFLPYYKGRAPITWAIINGEEYAGVTVHFINEGVDTGDIIIQEKVRIEDDDRGIDLLIKMLPLFPKLVLEAVNLIRTNKVQPKPQNPYEGCYFPLRNPINSVIDWQNETAREIHNRVRALAYPYPSAFFFLSRKKVSVLKTRLSDGYAARKISPRPGLVFGKAPNGGVKVTTVDGFIVIEELEIDGKKHKGDFLKIGSHINYDFLEKLLIERGDWSD